MTRRNHYLPIFLPAQVFGTYGWYVAYGYATSPDALDGLHLSDVQPIGPWPSWEATLALCNQLNTDEVANLGLIATPS